MNTILAGYKQTENGVIPEDWEVKKIADASPLQRGFDLPNRELQQGNYPVVYSNGIVNYHNKYQAKAPGIVTGRSGTIGKVTYVEEDYWPHNTSLWVTDFKNNDPKFMYYLFLKVKLERFATGSGVPTLNRNDVHDYKISLPPKTEQQLIATTLSDTDLLIESLEKLIAKKRQIKHGAMQELLTPKEGWEVKSILESMDCFDNLRVPLNETQRNEMKGDIPYCGANGVVGFVNDYVIDDDIILIAEDGGYFDEYAYRPIAYRMVGKCWVNNHAHILKAKSGFDQSFLFYSLVHKNILNFLASGTRAKLNKSEMWKIEVNMPPELSEQTAIAAILSDMDAEITALEERLAKTRTLKSGMMHELLTGRIRLI